MKSPLNIEKTVRQYGLDEELKLKLISFQRFIWQDCEIKTVEQIESFEKEYQKLEKDFDFCYNTEIGEFGCVDMSNGLMDLLCKGRFRQLSEKINTNSVYKAYINAGLSDLEALVITTFRADISGMYRLDAYNFGIPPFIRNICNVLNGALDKLPIYSEWVVRSFNNNDKTDFTIGNRFYPGFCLTTSADLSWCDFSENRYRIKPKADKSSKARAMFQIDDNTEQQVSFLQDALFLVTEINDWGEDKKEYVMEEI